jgi:phage portal protein BeeE
MLNAENAFEQMQINQHFAHFISSKNFRLIALA